jgi:hypothetical protein
MLIHRLIEELMARGDEDSPVPGMSNARLAKELEGATLLDPEMVERAYIPGWGGTPERPIPRTTWIEWEDDRERLPLLHGWLVVPEVEEVELWLAYRAPEGGTVGMPAATVVSAPPTSKCVPYCFETSVPNRRSLARLWGDIYEIIAAHHSGLADTYDDDFFFVDVATE